jgi:hypothetical protein
MSATWAGMGIAIVVTGALMGPDDARWVWAISAAILGIAAVVGYVLARDPTSARARVEAPSL